jgi:cholecystokinin A receptor/hypocretin (orexin) receptor 2
VKEKQRSANIKTAGILFIVTIVFIIAFLPAWLMAMRALERKIRLYKITTKINDIRNSDA